MFTYSTFYLTGFCFFSCSAWLCRLLSNGFQEVRKCFFVRIHRCFFMMEALMRTVPNCIQTIPDRLGIRFPGIGNRIPGCWEQTSRCTGPHGQCGLLRCPCPHLARTGNSPYAGNWIWNVLSNRKKTPKADDKFAFDTSSFIRIEERSLFSV